MSSALGLCATFFFWLPSTWAGIQHLDVKTLQPPGFCFLYLEMCAGFGHLVCTLDPSWLKRFLVLLAHWGEFGVYAEIREDVYKFWFQYKCISPLLPPSLFPSLLSLFTFNIILSHIYTHACCTHTVPLPTNPPALAILPCLTKPSFCILIIAFLLF